MAEQLHQSHVQERLLKIKQDLRDVKTAVLEHYTARSYSTKDAKLNSWMASFERETKPSGSTAWIYDNEDNFNAVHGQLMRIRTNRIDLEGFFVGANLDIAASFRPSSILGGLIAIKSLSPPPGYASSLAHFNGRISLRQASMRKIATRGPAEEGGLYL